MPDGASERTTVARVWRGWTAAGDAAAYVDYLQRTGIRAYRETEGNLGAWILHRIDGDRAEFVVLSMWQSEAAIRAFAGADIGKAVFYPEDERFLLECDERVYHYEIVRPLQGPALNER
jgi:heme-degrading monooxygenase HmoA